MKSLIVKAREFAYAEIDKTGMPLRKHVDLSTKKAIELAEKLKADSDVVEVGTLLMDCMIGKAINENRLSDHVEMSFEAAKELMDEVDMSEEKKKNIEQCILQHHGSDNFHSLESEICCNADCYRFASVEGFLYVMRYFRKMEFGQLIGLAKNKFEEKKNVLSLQICEKELEIDLKLIPELFKKIDNLN